MRASERPWAPHHMRPHTHSTSLTTHAESRPNTLTHSPTTSHFTVDAHRTDSHTRQHHTQ
jgi:hypothetical protein